jgi:broad specificity phosphatase PhoE
VDVTYKPLMLPRHPETNPEMLARCAETAQRLAEAFQEDMLIIGHGASVSGLTEGFLGRKPGLSCCGVCALTEIVRQGGTATLVLNGDASHLTGGDVHSGKLI